MATNEVYTVGNRISLPVPAGTKSGTALRIGSLNAIAVTDRADSTATPPVYGGGNPNGYASCWLDGGHSFQLGTGAVSEGDPIYIASDGTLSKTASGNQLFGHALSAKPSAAGPVVVRIAN